ncbi:4'-phosphopantetheinyl transferase superfamily protein [Allosaccharopolyspora coralli]|uniref:4'-phosphopantetheinyl transferase superfamily protein n=1 Tax=Allosaccharopolyspora coralli TaxID=2665642 RepID=A0A5Q3QGE4_9PSEU|nr:4'-phosphopantetheinyl transferase superfamily protein [Allosaccharopolyspora coralli]QGK70539.1 4'-phosphopantetheinyl transferase superfamily protein [Allosaccharopolyspora coralli]
MIERILPECVVARELDHDPPEAALLDAEHEAVARAVASRRAEFTTTRHCAHLALAGLGWPAVAIPRGERGAPQWPDGVVGSLTHCEGYRAAAVARRTDLRSVGIDAEPHRTLPDGVLRVVALDEEREMLDELARVGTAVHWDRLLFCAKEAVYKTWFPMTGSWLGFEDARVRLDHRHDRVDVELRVPAPMVDGIEVAAFSGRWITSNGTLAVALTHPA